MKKLFLPIVLTIMTQATWAAEFDINNYKGKVVYLDFWASWCGPCKESFPWLNSMKNKYKDIVIVGVNLDSNKKDADDFLKKYPAQFTVLFDPEGKLAEKFQVKGMPYSIVFDANGEQKFSHIGFSMDKASEYEKEIMQLKGNKK